MNKLTLNTNKTELIFFSCNYSDFGSIFYKNEALTTQKNCRYIGIQIDRNLSFLEQLNKTLKKMAHAIRSIYLIRHQVPLNARILLLKSLVLSHLSFSAIFFQYLSAKKLKRLNRQINWGIKVCFLRKKYDKARDLLIQTKTLPAELIIAKMSLIKLHHDIARPENSENLHGYLSLHQNTRTKLDKMPKPVLEWIRLFVNAYKNGISYHIGFGWQKMETFLGKRWMISCSHNMNKFLWIVT